MKKLLAILLVCAMVFSFTGAVFAADEAPAAAKVVITDNKMTKVPNCASLEKAFPEDSNLLVFKKGNAFVIWTATAVPEEYQNALIEAIEASEYENADLADLDDATFEYGYETFVFVAPGNSDQDVTVNADGSLYFEGKSTWSWFYYGNYTINEKEYEWVKVGDDSATGMGTKISTKNQWFMYNTGAGTFDIQAGNPKNDTNFVGEYEVKALGDNKYVIVDKASNPDALDNAPAAAGQKQTVISGAKFWVNNDGKFETSPGNQKGKANLVEAGEVFTVDGPLYVFAHFNVDYYVAQEVVEEVLPQ